MEGTKVVVCTACARRVYGVCTACARRVHGVCQACGKAHREGGEAVHAEAVLQEGVRVEREEAASLGGDESAAARGHLERPLGVRLVEAVLLQLLHLHLRHLLAAHEHGHLVRRRGVDLRPAARAARRGARAVGRAASARAVALRARVRTRGPPSDRPACHRRRPSWRWTGWASQSSGSSPSPAGSRAACTATRSAAPGRAACGPAATRSARPRPPPPRRARRRRRRAAARRAGPPPA